MMIESATPGTTQDAAVRFTLTYLTIIERNLEISYSSQGEPICVPGNITVKALSNLAYELRNLLCGEDSRAAIEACRLYGERIQSIGFGHVSDFDAFVKVGFLYSERVVIWDILSSRVLKPNSVTETSRSIIADLACSLLLLRTVVELGGVIVLPHPLMWSEAARKTRLEFAKLEDTSSAALGLSFALVAIDEGLPLHPYTLATTKKRPVAPGIQSGAIHEPYATEAHDFVFAVTALMETDEFHFLRNVRLDDFYRITVSYPELHRALRKQFASLSGLSPQQARKEMDAISVELKKLSIERDKSIANYGIDGTLASAGVLTSALAMVASPTGATLLAILGISTTAITAAKRWLALPSKNVVVRAFSDLRSANPFSLEFSTEIPRIDELQGSVERNPELAVHIDAIEAESWTEGAHLYLEELDEETAFKVLNALRPEQMYQLVNYRHRQQDYIGDYLEYVWKTNPDAFWRHIDQTFMSDEGMVMYDLDNVHRVLISEDMPLTVWMTLLNFIPSVYAEVLNGGEPDEYRKERGCYVVDFQVEQLVKVISYQLLESRQKAGKLAIFCLWLSNLGAEERSTIDLLLPKIFPAGLPNWIE